MESMPNNVLSGQLIKSSSVNAMLAEIRRTRAATLVAMKAGSPLPRTRVSGGAGGGSGRRSPFEVAICRRRTKLSCGDFYDTFYLDVNGGSWFGNGTRAHPTGNFIGEDEFPASSGEDVFLMCGGWLEIGKLTKENYSCTETGDIRCVCKQFIKPCANPWAFFMYDTGGETCITHPKMFYLNADSKQVKDILSGGALKGTMLSVITVNKVFRKRSQNFSPTGYEISYAEFGCGQFPSSTEILRSDYWYGGGGDSGFDEDNYPLGWNELAPNVWAYSGSVGVVSGVNVNGAAFGSAALKLKLFTTMVNGTQVSGVSEVCFGWSDSCVSNGFQACGLEEYSTNGGLFSRTELNDYGNSFASCANNYALVKDCGGIYDFSAALGEGEKLGVILRKLKNSTEMSVSATFEDALYYVPLEKPLTIIGGKSQQVVMMRTQMSAYDASASGPYLYCGTKIYRRGDNISFVDPFFYNGGESAGGRVFEFYVPVGIVRKTKRMITCKSGDNYIVVEKDVADVSTFTHGMLSPSLFFTVVNNRTGTPQSVVVHDFRRNELDFPDPPAFTSLAKELPDGSAAIDCQKGKAECAISCLGGKELPQRTENNGGGTSAAAASVASVSAAAAAKSTLLSAFPEDAAEIAEAQDL